MQYVECLYSVRQCKLSDRLLTLSIVSSLVTSYTTHTTLAYMVWRKNRQKQNPQIKSNLCTFLLKSYRNNVLMILHKKAEHDKKKWYCMVYLP